jgi:RimJ/RimL family protein N-acetyltransferase
MSHIAHTDAGQDERSAVLGQRHEQMLRLVAKGFYNELINYGVTEKEILTVTAHLLDNVMRNGGPKDPQVEFYNTLFTIKHVQDDWQTAKRLSLQQVSITPLEPRLIPQIAAWMRTPSIQASFYPRFPETEEELVPYFKASGRVYFAIMYQANAVGIIGAEQIDLESAKLEMRKLIGDPSMHGKGIGKRATFLFLYYVFVVLKFQKVLVHSFDVNVRNLNLNGKLGFVLEGTLFEDVLVHNTRRDVVRMALTASTWLRLFS